MRVNFGKKRPADQFKKPIFLESPLKCRERSMIRLPVRTKVLLIFLLLLAATGFISLRMFAEMEVVTRLVKNVNSDFVEQERVLAGARRALEDWNREVDNFLLASTEERRSKADEGISVSSGRFEQSLSTLESGASLSESEKKSVRGMTHDWSRLQRVKESIFSALKAENRPLARELYLESFLAPLDALGQGLDRFHMQVMMRLEQTILDAEERHRDEVRNIVLVSFGSFVVLLFLSWLFTEKFVYRVRKMASFAAGVQGWLTGGEKRGEPFPAADLEVKSKDEMGDLAAALTGLTTSLKGNIDERERVQRSLEDNVDALETINRGLEQSYQELSGFASVAAHDLRTPLTNLCTAVDLLKERLRERLGAEEKDVFEILSRNLRRMSGQVSTLYRMSKLETGTMRIVPVDLDRLVSDLTRGALKESLVEHGAAVDIESPLGEVRGDEGFLGTVVQNLVENAVKYRSPDRDVKIAIVSKRNSSGAVRVKVMDNGKGIKEEDIPKLFKMFARLHDSSRIEGLGVGLAHCKRLIERLGGTMGVESTYGLGSTFWFTVPGVS